MKLTTRRHLDCPDFTSVFPLHLSNLVFKVMFPSVQTPHRSVYIEGVEVKLRSFMVLTAGSELTEHFCHFVWMVRALDTRMRGAGSQVIQALLAIVRVRCSDSFHGGAEDTH